MLVTREPFVFPTEWEWTALLFGIAIAGFAAQVSHFIFCRKVLIYLDGNPQTLLAVGFVHETAGRGTMGVYSQVMCFTIWRTVWLIRIC